MKKVLACNRLEGSHTSLNIETFLQSTISQFQLDGKIVSITTDNGANIVKAVRDSGIPHIPCFAHTLNLAVGDVLTAVEALGSFRSKLSKIVSLTKRSTLAKEALVQCQRDRGVPERILIQECTTRWNSMYLMMQRIHDEQESLKMFMERFNVSNSIGALSTEEWNMLQSTLELFKPLYEFTVEMSSEKMVTSSKVLPMCKLLLRYYKRAYDEEIANAISYSSPTFRHNLTKELHEAMKARLTPFFSNHSLKMSCLLDPRFKRMGLIGQQQADEISAAMKAEGLALLNSMGEATPTTSALGNSRPTMSSLWSEFESGTTGLENSSMFEAEFRAWFREGLAERTTDVVSWWDTNKVKFPTLFSLASKYLIIQGTSVPSERLFSSAGLILNELRSRLSDGNAEMIIFCNSNMKIENIKPAADGLS